MGWTMVAAIVYGSLMHSPPSLGFEESDKLEHLGSYGLVMFWFGQLYLERRVRLGYALGFAALGVALTPLTRRLIVRYFDRTPDINQY